MSSEVEARVDQVDVFECGRVFGRFDDCISLSYHPRSPSLLVFFPNGSCVTQNLACLTEDLSRRLALLISRANTLVESPSLPPPATETTALLSELVGPSTEVHWPLLYDDEHVRVDGSGVVHVYSVDGGASFRLFANGLMAELQYTYILASGIRTASKTFPIGACPPFCLQPLRLARDALDAEIGEREDVKIRKEVTAVTPDLTTESQAKDNNQHSSSLSSGEDMNDHGVSYHRKPCRARFVVDVLPAHTSLSGFFDHDKGRRRKVSEDTVTETDLLALHCDRTWIAASGSAGSAITTEWSPSVCLWVLQSTLEVVVRLCDDSVLTLDGSGRFWTHTGFYSAKFESPHRIYVAGVEPPSYETRAGRYSTHVVLSMISPFSPLSPRPSFVCLSH